MAINLSEVSASLQGQYGVISNLLSFILTHTPTYTLYMMDVSVKNSQR